VPEGDRSDDEYPLRGHILFAPRSRGQQKHGVVARFFAPMLQEL
jgi:hypothetical protein